MPAGHPRADQPDQGRLDDMLMIDEIVVVAFIDRLEQPPANFRQNADAHVFVFEIDDVIGFVGLFVRQRIVQRIRIDPAFGALRSTAEIKHRARLWIAGEVGRNDNVLFGYGNLIRR